MPVGSVPEPLLTEIALCCFRRLAPAFVLFYWPVKKKDFIVAPLSPLFSSGRQRACHETSHYEFWAIVVLLFIGS